MEVADTGAKRHQGLSGREVMGEDEGMLFVFEDYTGTSFVMRGMLFPLDIIWIKDNAVVGCSQNLPAPKAGESPVVVSPAEPVNYVLEVNGGWCERNNIQGGDKVEGIEIKK